MSRNLFIVLSAPSGAGKTTLCCRLREAHPEWLYSVSCTTRPPRGQEVDSEAYHFLSDAGFEEKVRAGSFLEHATVHGCRYGTLGEPIRAGIASGRDVLMDIDVQGARQIRSSLELLPEDDLLRAAFLDIFIAVPSLDVLQERIEGRGENNPEDVARRLENAAAEMACADEYRHVVMNDSLDSAYAELAEICEQARSV